MQVVGLHVSKLGFGFLVTLSEALLTHAVILFMNTSIFWYSNLLSDNVPTWGILNMIFILKESMFSNVTAVTYTNYYLLLKKQNSHEGSCPSLASLSDSEIK